MTHHLGPKCLVNGIGRDSIPVSDRGLLYGDGLFETIAFVHGHAPLWDLHIQRLMRSCERLFLPAPDPVQLIDECHGLVQGCDRTVVRITLTRGSGGQAYCPPAQSQPNRILMRRSFPATEGGVSMIRSSVPVEQSPALSGMKHLNRLEHVLIGRECQQRNASEALIADSAGWIVEGLASNLLIEKDGELILPGPHPAAVDGVGLAWLRSRSGNGMTERPFHVDELTSSDALWVINSVAGIRAVSTLDGQAHPRGSMLDQSIQAWKHTFNL